MYGCKICGKQIYSFGVDHSNYLIVRFRNGQGEKYCHVLCAEKEGYNVSDEFSDWTLDAKLKQSSCYNNTIEYRESVGSK